MYGREVKLPIPRDKIDDEYIRSLVRELEIAFLGVYADYGNYAEGSATWNPGSLGDGVGETSADIAVPGAALGDYVLVGVPYSLQGILCTGYVSAADVVTVRLQNETTGTIDLASGTWKVRVIKAI